MSFPMNFSSSSYEKVRERREVPGSGCRPQQQGPTMCAPALVHMGDADCVMMAGGHLMVTTLQQQLARAPVFIQPVPPADASP